MCGDFGGQTPKVTGLTVGRFDGSEGSLQQPFDRSFAPNEVAQVRSAMPRARWVSTSTARPVSIE